MIQLDAIRYEGGAHKLKEQHKLIVVDGGGGGAAHWVGHGGPLIGGGAVVGAHEVAHIVPPEDGVATHLVEHLLRDGDLKNRLETAFFVQIRTELPH